MKSKAWIFHSIIIIALTNLIIIIAMQEHILASLLYGLLIVQIILLLGCSLRLISMSVQAISKIDKHYVHLSSKLTFLFKYAFTSLAISCVLSLTFLGTVQNGQLLPIALIIFVVNAYPTILTLRTTYIAYDEQEILIVGFSEMRTVQISHIQSISKLAFGAEYRIYYEEQPSRKIRMEFLYPKGSSVFHEPDSIKNFKAFIGKDRFRKQEFIDRNARIVCL